MSNFIVLITINMRFLVTCLNKKDLFSAQKMTVFVVVAASTISKLRGDRTTKMG